MANESDQPEPFEEIRAIRRGIAEEFGNDPWKYGEYLTRLQNSPELRDRLYTPARPDRKKPAA